ncbi:MAG: hypothetical protein WKF83_04710 [Nocardioidaceae bacterium]
MVLTGSAATVSATSAAARPLADQRRHSFSVQSWSPPTAAGAEGTKDSTASGASSPAAPDQVAGQRKGRVTYYDVKPPHGRNYDTLWDIAERYLGDGLRYKEIYRLNKDQTQPDGQVMTQADLIHPGWVIQLPPDAKGPELKIVDYGRGEDDMAAVTREVTARPAAAQSEAGLHSDVAPQSDVEMDSAAAGRSGDDADTRATEPQTPSWAPVFGVAGGLLAASLLMRLRRRSASMSAAALWAGRADTEPDTHGAGSGVPMPVMALREEADEETALWVDRALRAWNPVNGTVPAPARCTLGTDGLVMAFAAAPGRPYAKAGQRGRTAGSGLPTGRRRSDGPPLPRRRPCRVWWRSDAATTVRWRCSTSRAYPDWCPSEASRSLHVPSPSTWQSTWRHIPGPTSPESPSSVSPTTSRHWVTSGTSMTSSEPSRRSTTSPPSSDPVADVPTPRPPVPRACCLSASRSGPSSSSCALRCLTPGRSSG